MRRLVLLLCLSLGAAVAGAAPPVTNLVPDPGFEAKSWTLTSWEICQYKSEYVSQAHSGKVAIQLTAIKPGKDNRISAIAIGAPAKVEGGHDYLISLWYKTQDVSRSVASVSVISLAKPFATAGFKTPKTSYRTFSLPVSPVWTLWSTRYHMPDGSVQALILPRVMSVGAAWFDDLCMVPADQAEIDFTAAGEVVQFPNTRRFQASLQLPLTGQYEFEMIDRQSGKAICQMAAKPEINLSPTVAEGQTLDAVVTQPRTNIVLAHTVVQVPPLVQFALKYPRYRHTIYPGETRQAIGELTINAAPALAREVKYAATVAPASATKPVVGSFKPTAPSQEIKFSLARNTPPAKLAVFVSVKTPVKSVELKAPFRLVGAPPAGVHAFRVGDNNQLLMDGRPFFARGFMGGGPEVFGPVVKAGFNIGSTFGGSVDSCLKYLDGMQKLGLYGIIGLPATFVKKGATKGLREAIAKVKNHPALLGYYLIDEPSPSAKGLSPKDLQPFYDIIADEDPYHPVMATMYNAGFAPDYLNCLDILLFDPYPITKQPRPLTMVGQFMTQARQLISDRKPVWDVPQAFGGDVIKNVPASYSWLTPSPAQERCMTYLALAAGANGLDYYCYHVYTGYNAAAKAQGRWPWTLGGYLPDKQPALWQSLVQIGRELKVLAPALCRPSRTWSQNGLYLREMAPTPDASGYLLAVNPSENKTAAAMVKLHTPVPPGNLKDLDGAAGPRITPNGLSLRLAPMQVGIFELPSQKER